MVIRGGSLGGSPQALLIKVLVLCLETLRNIFNDFLDSLRSLLQNITLLRQVSHHCVVEDLNLLKNRYTCNTEDLLYGLVLKISKQLIYVSVFL